MATFIRGKSGLVEELELQAKKLENRLNNFSNRNLNQKLQARLQGEHDALASLAAWLKLSDVHVLTESEYDVRMARFNTLPQVEYRRAE